MGTWAERFDFYESKITKPEYNPRTESDIPPITSAPMDYSKFNMVSRESKYTVEKCVTIKWI